VQDAKQEQHHESVSQHLRRHAAAQNNVRRRRYSAGGFPRWRHAAWRHTAGIPSIARGHLRAITGLITA